MCYSPEPLRCSLFLDCSSPSNYIFVSDLVTVVLKWQPRRRITCASQWLRQTPKTRSSFVSSAKKLHVHCTDQLLSTMHFTAVIQYGTMLQISSQETWKKASFHSLMIRVLRRSTSLMFRGHPGRFTITGEEFFSSADVIQFKITKLWISTMKTLKHLIAMLPSYRNDWQKWRTLWSARFAWTDKLTRCFVHVGTWFHAVSVQLMLVHVQFAEQTLNMLNMPSFLLLLERPKAARSDECVLNLSLSCVQRCTPLWCCCCSSQILVGKLANNSFTSGDPGKYKTEKELLLHYHKSSIEKRCVRFKEILI